MRMVSGPLATHLGVKEILGMALASTAIDNYTVHLMYALMQHISHMYNVFTGRFEF